MNRGAHPERTPFYGALLVISAMISGSAVTWWSSPATPLRDAVLALALVVAIAGSVMTLRDRY
jgi:hypothetical protein